MAVTQLVINETPYPESDDYKVYPEELGEQLTMISGRLVEEVRGTVDIIEYSYKYFDKDLMRKCLSDLRSKQVLEVTYLVPESDEMKQGRFICTSKPTPRFGFSVDAESYFVEISFTLRQEVPT